jgi:hypothetical protein
MPPQGDDGVGVGELSRQVQQVLLRFESLATRLETQFVNKESYSIYQLLVDQEIKTLQDTTKQLATAETANSLKSEVEGKASNGALKGLEQRVSELEDDRKWLVRLLIGFIVLGVLSAIYVAAGPR